MSSSLITPKSAGMPAAQIKGLLALREETIEAVGHVIGERPAGITDTINRNRRNERIRKKLCGHLNLEYTALWGSPKPAKKRVLEVAA